MLQAVLDTVPQSSTTHSVGLAPLPVLSGDMHTFCILQVTRRSRISYIKLNWDLGVEIF